MASEMKTTSLEGASGMEIAGGSHTAMLFFSAVQRILFGLKKRVALLGNSYHIPPKKKGTLSLMCKKKYLRAIFAGRS